MLMTAGVPGRIQIINCKAANFISYKYFQWAFPFTPFRYIFVFKILEFYSVPTTDLNPAQYP